MLIGSRRSVLTARGSQAIERDCWRIQSLHERSMKAGLTVIISRWERRTATSLSRRSGKLLHKAALPEPFG